MIQRPNKLETRFEEYGSLPKPRIVGRIIRFGLGVWLLGFVYQLMVFGPSGLVDRTPPTHWTFWAAALLGITVTPYVVNIGLSRNWKHWPRVFVIAVGVVLAAVDLALYGTWWAPPLGTYMLVWSIYWSAHLGLSFLLAAFINTPGCEMRAIPHLWTRITGRLTKEHYCPGFLDSLDRWERKEEIR